MEWTTVGREACPSSSPTSEASGTTLCIRGQILRYPSEARDASSRPGPSKDQTAAMRACTGSGVCTAA